MKVVVVVDFLYEVVNHTQCYHMLLLLFFHSIAFSLLCGIYHVSLSLLHRISSRRSQTASIPFYISLIVFCIFSLLFYFLHDHHHYKLVLLVLLVLLELDEMVVDHNQLLLADHVPLILVYLLDVFHDKLSFYVVHHQTLFQHPRWTLYTEIIMEVVYSNNYVMLILVPLNKIDITHLMDQTLIIYIYIYKFSSTQNRISYI